jgi:hypothetical protein
MRTSFHHQPEAQHPNFQLPTSLQADYPIFREVKRTLNQQLRMSEFGLNGHWRGNSAVMHNRGPLQTMW